MRDINYESIAQEIIDIIGGNDNIISVNCCATRVKIKYLNIGTIDSLRLERLEEKSGIPKGAFFSNGYLQLIVGSNNTHRLYNEMISILGDQITEEHSIQHTVNPCSNEDVSDSETDKELSEAILSIKKAFAQLMNALEKLS